MQLGNIAGCTGVGICRQMAKEKNIEEASGISARCRKIRGDFSPCRGWTISSGAEKKMVEEHKAH